MDDQKPDGEKPIPVWQKLGALAVFLAVAACLVAFRHRLGADFLPPDSSRVGPNLIASIVTWAVLFILAVLLWPPTRRRLHRFMDRKLAPLHETHAALHAELAHLRSSHEQLHAKLDALGQAPPVPVAAVIPVRRARPPEPSP